MEKFLKISLSDAYHLIPIKNSEVLGVEIVATTAADAAKTKEQLNSIVDAIEMALQTSWTNPFYVLQPKYVITAVNQIEVEYSA